VRVTPICNPIRTGNFEVVIVGPQPKLIHSKATRKQGRCETAAEIDAVLDAIGKHIEQAK
jgi:hypothetical protein